MSEAVKVYSNAIFELGLEENLLSVINQDLKDCSNIFKVEPDFLTVLSSPVITNKEKVSMLKAVFQDNCNELVFNFMCLLVEKNRINLFCEIQQDFTAQFNKYNGMLDVEVITCVPLSNELRNKIIEKLKRQTGKTITITETLDQSILGGIIIKYDNTIIDDSVKTKFKELSKRLHNH